MAVVECVANISEGRDPVVVDACGAAVAATGAALLDVHRDVAHHRSVFTFAGAPATVARAAIDLVTVAVARVDLRHHTGVHPRIGAADVIPFVPISGVTLADCVDMARDVARTLSVACHLPVFLYEAAATRPERRRLEDIRRGGFEGLAQKLQDPAWQPDFGPAVPHATAGATVVGARKPLVAFNVNLASDRLEVAQAIARAVRERSGGLAGVKALGLPLADRGIVQVSMNVTDLDRTPLHVVFARVTAEAVRHGVGISHSEIVGLAPSAVFEAAAANALQLSASAHTSVLERRLLEHGLGL